MSDAENLERVERMLERIGRSTRQAKLLMAELLELRAQETLSQAEMTPAQRKNATLEILEAFLVAPLDGATVLLLLEDAHWSDSDHARRSSSGCWAGSRAITRWSSLRIARN